MKLIEEPPIAELTVTEERFYVADMGFGTSGDRFRRWQLIRQNMEKGIMPPLGNGFEFVFDECPGGHSDTNNHIPAVEFTQYFSESKVPLAAIGHPMHGHDVGHIEGYQELFRHETIAELIRSSARYAVNTFDDSVKLATAVDRLSEIVDDLKQGLGRKPDTETASGHIAKLIGLKNGRRYDFTNPEDRELFETVWALLHLEYHKAILEAKEKQQAHVLAAIGSQTVRNGVTESL